MSDELTVQIKFPGLRARGRAQLNEFLQVEANSGPRGGPRDTKYLPSSNPDVSPKPRPGFTT